MSSASTTSAPPRYPELVLTTGERTLAEDPALVAGMVAATRDGYARLATDPEGALDELLAAVPALSEREQRAQLDALLEARALGRGVELDRRTLAAWARWDAEHGIVAAAPRVAEAFELELEPR